MTEVDFLGKKEALRAEIARLEAKRILSETVSEDYYEPGMMENLNRYLGNIDEETGMIEIRFESRGLRYDERTQHLNRISIGDEIRLVREKQNPFNSNNFMLLNKRSESLGNMPAELCNVIGPLFDAGCLQFLSSTVSYLERIAERSRYARQGVLFVDLKMQLKNRGECRAKPAE